MDERQLEPVDRFAWERIVRATETTSTVRLVALTLATYGDRHGRNLRPGVARLAAACGLGQRATIAALGALRDLGLLERTVTGSTMGTRATTDEHRLTRPAQPPAAPRAGGEEWEDTGPAAPRAGGDAGPPASEARPPAREARPPASDDTTTGTTCTPSDLYQVMTKSSSWPGAAQVNGSAGGPTRPTDDDLAIEIADENDWPIEHALVVIRGILARASSPPRFTHSYVRAAIRSEPDQYRPSVRSRPLGIPRHPFVDDPNDPGCADCAMPRANGVHGYIDGRPEYDR